MASLSSSYGSRKSIYSALPFLTAKSVVPIAEYLSNYKITDEGVLLTGMLFCGLWNENNESSISEEFYDLSFTSFKDYPVECVKMYLQRNNISGDKMNELIESSFEKGFLKENPPFIGTIGITNPDGTNPDQKGKEYILDKGLPPKQNRSWEVDLGPRKNLPYEWDYLNYSGLFWNKKLYQSWYEIIIDMVPNTFESIKYDEGSKGIVTIITLINNFDQKYSEWIEEGVLRDHSGEVIARIKVIDQ